MFSWIHEFMTYQGTWKSGDAFMNSWIHEFMTYQGKWKSGDPTDIVSHQNYDLMLMGMKACFYAFLPLC